ncbi:hypothetical protein CBS101457_006808 [Exobasidium rhododendri]|nr:hypothetical protein CBS101457_006808 [Exobasidium rhododendri]
MASTSTSQDTPADGPVDVRIDLSHLTEKNVASRRRQYEVWVNPSGTITSVAGTTYKFGFSNRSTGRFEKLSRWFKNGLVSVALKPCRRCSEINSARDPEDPPWICFVSAYPSNVRSDGVQRCAYCSLTEPSKGDPCRAKGRTIIASELKPEGKEGADRDDTSGISDPPSRQESDDEEYFPSSPARKLVKRSRRSGVKVASAKPNYSRITSESDDSMDATDDFGRMKEVQDFTMSHLSSLTKENKDLLKRVKKLEEDVKNERESGKTEKKRHIAELRFQEHDHRKRLEQLQMENIERPRTMSSSLACDRSSSDTTEVVGHTTEESDRSFLPAGEGSQSTADVLSLAKEELQSAQEARIAAEGWVLAAERVVNRLQAQSQTLSRMKGGQDSNLQVSGTAVVVLGEEVL